MTDSFSLMMEGQKAEVVSHRKKKRGINEAIWDAAEHKLFVIKDPREAAIKILRITMIQRQTERGKQNLTDQQCTSQECHEINKAELESKT